VYEDELRKAQEEETRRQGERELANSTWERIQKMAEDNAV